jgi:O-antigen ligase
MLTTDSQSAHLIIGLCAIFWMGFPVSNTKIWYGFWALLTGLLFAAPWFAQYMFNVLPPMIEGVEWFKQSYALNRLEIWDYIGRYIETNPIYGFGIEATRSIEDFDSAYLYDDKATVLHPHNFALQLWIEFGVMGAALGALAIGYVLKAMSQLDAARARLGVTVFIGLLCPAATAYGMWQGWFIGLFFMMAGYCLIAMQRAGRDI